MARHGANCASPCCLERLRATKMARRGTPYCGALRGVMHALAISTQSTSMTQVHFGSPQPSQRGATLSARAGTSHRQHAPTGAVA